MSSTSILSYTESIKTKVSKLKSKNTASTFIVLNASKLKHFCYSLLPLVLTLLLYFK